MVQIVSYLKNGTLPEDRNASQRLKIQASCFVLMYLVLDKADYVMREAHEGCGETTRGHGQ